MPRRSATPKAVIAAEIPAATFAPVVPSVPSPAVLELQSDIVALVRERSGYRKQVLEIQAALFKAQAEFQATQAGLNQFEQEIAERMALIAQLENRAPQAQYPAYQPDPGILTFPGNMTGISSEPAAPVRHNPPMPDPNDMINRGNASGFRAEAQRSVL